MKTRNRHRQTAKDGKQPFVLRRKTIARLLLLIGSASPTYALAALPCGGCGNFVPVMPAYTTNLPTICTPGQGNCGTTQVFKQAGAVDDPVIVNKQMTINQHSPTAILNWNDFNIRNGYAVVFNQPSSTASTLNRIWDANPSVIAGSLTANGQIYLINQSGIVFANGAQVSVNGLIASSLDISDSLYQAGYLTNNTSLQNGYPILPAFQGTGGFVRVDTGAVLNGSRIMMFAPVVENRGNITTADGQAVLAAGNKVYLEASQDPNLRGVLVEVDVTNPGQAVPGIASGQVQNNAAGTVTNASGGSIVSERGNTTLIGYAVNQQGLISATSSVTENGSIKLLARHEVYTSTSSSPTQNQYLTGTGTPYYDIRAQQTGTVTLGQNSVTEVLPQLSDGTTITDSQTFNPSIIEVMGKTIDVQGSLLAPGGKVTLAAIGSINVGQDNNSVSNIFPYQEVNPNLAYSSFLNPNYIPVAAGDGAAVYLESGSLIDVSGSTASVSVARNILSVQLRGTQLADAPLQRNGPLWGQTVNIDIRQGSTLANISGDEAQIGRTVAERTASGGQVKIVSTDKAVLNPGSTINISGGQVNYTGAYVRTSQLIANGMSYDISTASPNLAYSGIAGTYTVNHAKWGVTETFSTLAGGDMRGKWDPGYVQGMSAGTLTILAPSAVVESNIIAHTVAGIYQRQPYVDPAGLAYKDTWQNRANGGTLIIGESTPTVNPSGQNDYLTNSNVVVQGNPQQVTYAAGDALPPAITLDAGLFSAGVNNLAVYTNGSVTVGAGTSLTLASGGSVKLQGGQVSMLGSITVPGGSVNIGTALTTENNSSTATVDLAGNISTRGTWVNDSGVFGAPDFATPIVKNGGNISIKAYAAANVGSGVQLDASGGGWVDTSGTIHGGNGGNITLAGATLSPLDQVSLKSFGVDTGKGGALALASQDVAVGGGGANGALAIPAQFFQSGGFTSYRITGLTNVAVAPGTFVNPKAQSLILSQNASLQHSGANIDTFSTAGFLPDWQRIPTGITLAQTASSGGVTIGANAEILVDPKANITLDSGNQVAVYGVLDAPAGSIDLNLNVPNGLPYLGSQSIWLGAGSELLSQGYFLRSQPDSKGLVQGQVLAGGTININSNGGFFVAQGATSTQPASLIDVSGTSATVDLPQMNNGVLGYTATRVAGDAGSVSVAAVDGAIFDGTLNGGVAAGSQAMGGSFSLFLNGLQFSNVYDITSPATNTLYQNTVWNLGLRASGAGSFAASLVSPTLKAGDSLASAEGQAVIDQHSLSSFGQVTLKSYNAITLADGVNLAARRNIVLDAPVLVSAGNAGLTSAHVTLGNLDQANQTPANPAVPAMLLPAAGTGSLNVAAQMVDLSGKFTVSDVNAVTVSSSGDVRFNGVFDNTLINQNHKVSAQDIQDIKGQLLTQGNVTLQASQVYASTLAQFKVAVEDGSGNPAGTIAVLGNGGAASPVLSAGGSITLSAANIVQNGVLKAPLGSIDLAGTNVTLGAGSLTSVSLQGQTVPFGFIQGGNTWYYDLTGAGNSSYFVPVTAPPQKIVKLEGANVTVAHGATVDLSGGGDLYASEFFAGIGGTTNVLDPAQAPANTFAILPGVSGYAPYDPQSAGQYAQGGSKTVLKDGAMVYLAGGNGLKPGYYTLLPASYALLPGAYRVTAMSGYQDMQPGQVSTLTDGTQVMAGKFAVAGTSIQDARWSGFAVSSGAIVRTQSEFHDSYASTFFPAQAAASGTLAPRLPVDAGQLIVSAAGASASLQLDGTINSQAGAGGQGAWVDLNGPGFDIVNTAGSGAAGLVELTTTMLDNLGADSLLIGGVRSQDANGMTLAVGASQVVVDNGGSVLAGPEIMLAASNAVTVKAGSSIQGRGTGTGQSDNITIGATSGASGDGALLRVSVGSQVTVTRNNLSAGATPTLTVESGAAVGAQNSVLLDSSYATNVDGNALLSGKAFSVAANNIDAGNNIPAGVSALVLSRALLSQMGSFNDITLHSYNDINFYNEINYGDVALGGLDANGRHLISNLVLNARSLNGSASGNVVVDAASVTLMNNNGNATSTMPAGSGSLSINADDIALSSGNSAIRGFDSVALNAAQQITGQGIGGLTVSSGNANVHSLALTGTVMGTAKSNQAINAAGYDATLATGGIPAAAPSDVGAAFALNAGSIADNGSIVMPSGTVLLHATNGITLGANSQTAAAGLDKVIAGHAAYAPAGTVTLTSDSGNVDIASGAVVDVAGATGGGDAGTLNVNATQGTASIAGTLRGSAAPGYAQGSFAVDASTLGSTLTALDNQLMSGGFNQSIDVRVRSGNLALDAGSTVTAHAYHLAADNGSIDVLGKVDASGASGGDILLAASNNVTLESTAVLDAHATGSGNKGGKVALETANGAVDLMTGSAIDVSGATPGSVLLRAPQINGGTDVAVNTVAGTGINVSANTNVTVEGYKNYTATTISGTDVTTTSTYYTDAAAFANNAAAIRGRLGMSASNMHVVPGIQINSPGDLTLASTWDLSAWRFSDGSGSLVPGILTLRAAGNLNLGYVTTDALGNITSVTTASLSDGFSSADFNTSNAFNLLQSSSWSYRLVAGADTAAANVMAVNNTGGSVVLAPGGSTPAVTQCNRGHCVVITPAQLNLEVIRTGTGFIDIAAGAGLYLGNSNSMIYTAGQQLQLPGNVQLIGATTATPFNTGGGDINVAVKGDISAVGLPDSSGKAIYPAFTSNASTFNWSGVNQLVTDWLWRQGGTSSTSPTAWWVNYATFYQNIGALGGGNVSISAGGNINSLSAVVPTEGYVDPATGVTQVLGGGNLSVKTGGNIDSGIFYVGNGQGTISAGGSLGASRYDANQTLYTILALGQGSFDVRSGGDLNLQTVVNPTMIFEGSMQTGGNRTFFSTYGDTAGSVALESLNGNVSLMNDTGFIKNNPNATPTSPYINSGTTSPSFDPGAMQLYPGSLSITALNGSIDTNVSPNATTPMMLFPSATGNLQLLAGADINFYGQLIMSDAAPYLMQPATPVSAYTSSLGVSNIDLTLRSEHGTTSPSSLLPLHSGDAAPVVIAAGGSITGVDNSPFYASLTLPKYAQIQAGQDITNLSAVIQNVASDNTTSFIAGHDVVFTANSTYLTQSTQGVTVYGPGQLAVQAGHNVDLGQSDGLLTSGNLANPYLSAQGADISVLAGVAGNAAGSQAFIAKYVNPASSSAQPYGNELMTFVNSYAATPVVTVADAYAAFAGMSADLQNRFVNQVFFDELRTSGRSAIGSGDYSAGYKAIATLFPGSHQGDISLYYSQIKTIEGGSINILTPGGGVNAGLANASSSGPQKTPAELGIVTVKGGDVNAFVNNDFLVNQSRVFTLQGGNILMWSSYGNLDAGKGSKTASATPPPQLVIDPKTGTFKVDVTNSVSGSGIRVLLANKDVVPGTVDLFAPSGTINAGDAGIGSAGNIYLGAQQVIGANNIDVGGTGVGIPAASAAPAPVSGLSSLQNASEAANQATQGLGNLNDADAQDFMPTFITVQVVGLGI